VRSDQGTLEVTSLLGEMNVVASEPKPVESRRPGFRSRRVRQCAALVFEKERTASLSVTVSKLRATEINCARVIGATPISTAIATSFARRECFEDQERGEANRSLIGAVSFYVDLSDVDGDYAVLDRNRPTNRRISSALKPPGAAAGQAGTAIRSAASMSMST